MPDENTYLSTISEAALDRIISRNRAKMLDYESAEDNRAEVVRPKLEAALAERKRREDEGKK